MVAFSQHGTPEPVVGFEYPDEPEPDATITPLELRLQGFNTAMALFLDWIEGARTSHARDIRLAALRCAFSKSTVNFTLEARRLGCTREWFSKAVSHIRRAMPLPK